MGKNLLIVFLSIGLGLSSWLLVREGAGDGRDRVGVEKKLSAVGPLAEVLGRMGDDLPGVVIGFCLLDAEGAVVGEVNSSMPMIPASTFKTLTTVAALDVLGPEFRFSTQVVSEDAVDGRISGDLVIRGGGDPVLELGDLAEWVDSLRKQGVRLIEGGVVGDGSFFPANMAGDFWGWGDVGNGYGSAVSGLNLEHNRFVATIRPGAERGEAAKFLGAKPEVAGVDWINRVKTGAKGSGDGVMIYGGPRATSILLTGTVPVGGDFSVRGAVPNPPLFAAYHFDRLLKKRGIQVGKEPRAVVDRVEMENEKVWVDHQSPDLAAILPGLHSRSDNHETECLFQMLGVVAGKPAADFLTDYWAKRGVEGIRVVDGSGLSRADFISAAGLARVQFVAKNSEHAAVYQNSLDVSHGGQVRWKAGGMSSIRSWTGFVGERSFALVFNHYKDASELNAWRDEIFETVLAGEKEE